MASSIQLLRSTISQERPFPTNLLEGQPAVNLNASEPGLFFKAADGSLVKFGPAAITSDGSPPNSSPQGSSGNTVGELWLDKSVDPAVLKVYDGAAWVDAGSGGGGGGGETTSFVRWIYTAIGGETALSGSSGGVLLDYTPGLEEVYVNGVLITRGTDYSATNGTSITNLSALTAGDVITVMSMNPIDVVQLPGRVTLLRWTVLATSGQTVLSGVDSSGQQLAYTPGFEEVYINGAFLRRGVDYIATDGSTITGLTPLAEDDEVTVMAWSTFSVGELITNGEVADNAGISTSKLSYLRPSEPTDNARTVTERFGDVVSVKDFGAKGDGVQDDRTAIVNALSAINPGGTLYFPDGTYRITNYIRTGVSDFTIRGSGQAKIVCEKYDTFDGVFQLTGQRVKVLDLNIECDIPGGPSGDMSAIGLELIGDYITVRDCFVYGCRYGYFCRANASYIIISGNRYDCGDSGLTGIEVSGASYVVVSDNLIERFRDTGISTHRSAEYVSITGNVVKAVEGEAASLGIIIEEGSSNIVVANNVLDCSWDGTVGERIGARNGMRIVTRGGGSYQAAGKNIVMSGNIVSRPELYGLTVDNNSTDSSLILKNIVLNSNIIDGSQNDNFRIFDADGLVLNANISSDAGDYGFYGLTSENLCYSANISARNTNGYRIGGASDSVFSGNLAVDNTNANFSATNLGSTSISAVGGLTDTQRDGGFEIVNWVGDVSASSTEVIRVDSIPNNSSIQIYEAIAYTTTIATTTAGVSVESVSNLSGDLSGTVQLGNEERRSLSNPIVNDFNNSGSSAYITLRVNNSTAVNLTVYATVKYRIFGGPQ